MRFQFSLAELLALTTIVSVGLGLGPLWRSSLLAIGVSASLLVGSIVGCVIGFCYGRVRWAVVWGILSSLLGTLGWLLTYNHEWNAYKPSWSITFIIVALIFSIPCATVAAVFNRHRHELLYWPCVNCFTAIAVFSLSGLALLFSGALVVWVYEQPWEGPGFIDIASAIPVSFMLAVVFSIAWGVTIGTLGLCIKGIFFPVALRRDAQLKPWQP